MSYSISAYLIRIDELKKAIGSKDRALMVAALKRKAKEDGEEFDESTLDSAEPIDEDEADESDEDWDSWNTVPAVKALVNGDLDHEKINGSQYGYALETLCDHLGKRIGIEPLESVRSSGEFSSYWEWFFSEKPLISFSGFNDGFPTIGYLHLDELPAEIKRTEELNFTNLTRKKDMSAKLQYKLQLDNELAVFSAAYDAPTVSPVDYPWLDAGYYDSLQTELESLGFRFVRDAELRQLTRVFPNIRHFLRSLVHSNGSIGASISQIRIVQPCNAEEKKLDVRCLELTSEFDNGSFLATLNTLGVNNPESVDGISVQNFPPNTSPKKLLELHQAAVLAYAESNNAKPLSFITNDDMISSDKRQHVLARADRKKKLKAYKAEAAGTEPDEELIEWLEEIRTDMLALYKKALEAKTDIVTFYY